MSARIAAALVFATLGSVGGVAFAQIAPRPQPVIVDVPVGNPPQAAPASRLIFMNRCPASVGCVIKPGVDDSRTNTSSIPDSQVTITGFKQSDAVWAKVMTCMRVTYAPFNIGVTDVDPGPGVPHYENIVGGRATELDSELAGAGGVAPFTCDEIPNAVSFTFDVYGADSDALCWTAAQETAHAFGLEHEYNAADPMTYLNGGPSMKRFQATDSPCGTFSEVPCRCTGASTQNSYRYIIDMFGPGAPTAPTVSIKSPSDGGKVQPKFIVRIAATDDVGIDRVELWIDGVNTGVVAKTPPYQVAAPESVGQGPHSVEVRAFDVQGTPAMASLEVDVGPPCTASKGCSGDDVCVMGVCLPGPDAPGGLGSFCNANTECLSNVCIGEEGGNKACVEPCRLDLEGACPEDFSCIPGGSGGVCWETGGGGCCETGSKPTGPALFALGVLGFLLRPRRRRSS
ncbi:MAG: Ig-like domain-containing protein [Deltaproteobacteria bacterium]|nr:Ig-like domain-containing protein [Deltaproteobacteria bacterium]